MEVSNLPETEFKTLVIRMPKKLRGRIDKLSENFNRDSKHKKDIETIKKELVRSEEYNI